MSGPSHDGSARKLLKAYRILCVAFAAFLLLYSGARVALLRAGHQDEARSGFQSARAGAKTAMAAFAARDDAFFSSGMKEIVRGQTGLQLLAVHESGRVYYFYASRGDLFPIAPQPTADMTSVPAYRSPTLSTLRLVSSFSVGTDSRTIDIDALYTVLGAADLHTLGKEIVYILLVFLIVTATMLVIVASVTAQAPRRSPARPASTPMEPPRSRAEPPSAEARSERPRAEVRPEQARPRPPEPVEMAPEEALLSSEEPAPRGAAEPERRPAEPVEEAADIAEPVAARHADEQEAAARDASKSFYSDASGLVYRDFLASRLRSEIDRAAASDQDMVLAIIGIDHWEAISRHDLVYSAIAGRLRGTFPYRDLVFEHEAGYAVIIPDINLDKALERFEDLRQKLEASPLEGKAVTVSVGIAARNGRLVSEETLLKEASHSLDKAVRDGANQVVAFRANPDKFRRVLAT